MPDLILDDFRDVSGWLAVASGLAKLAITSRPRSGGHPAMHLAFDFAGGGGFVVARKELALAVPETWALCFSLRGHGERNRLEIKLADPSGKNVWWYREEAFALPADWTPIVIPSRAIEFAWGPAGGGALRDVGAIEIALAAGPGGAGEVEVADLRIEDRTVRARPVVRASTALPGHAPDGLFDDPPAAPWRSEPTAPQWLEVDFQGEREYGGLVVDWEPAGRARAFTVATSTDGVTWTDVHATAHADAPRSWIPMPNTCARHLRLVLDASVAGAGFGITALAVRPFELSRTHETFFSGIAAESLRGSYPRWVTGEQSYWTPVGVPDGDTCALMNEEGLVEVDRGTWSLEPFVFADGGLVTWADADVAVELEDGTLPIPTSLWRTPSIELRTTAFAHRIAERPVLFVRYRVARRDGASGPLRLFVTARPFQVNPPWQKFGALGGVSPIRELFGDPLTMVVGGTRTVLPLERAAAFGAATFHQGNVVDHLRTGDVPPHGAADDDAGFAAGALRFDLDVGPGATAEVYVAVPFGSILDQTDDWIRSGLPVALGAGGGAAAFAATVRAWENKLGGLRITLGARWQRHADALRTAVAHVLVERDGPALQPGPRRYTRSWIRDGAIMAGALLRVGCIEEARAFVRWYAPFQRADGFVPCCVDRSGPDWLVEHDSHGELVFAIAECFRFTGDRAFLDALWPAVAGAVACIERLRATRLGPAWDGENERGFRGLLPESASHEGYLAHPVHAYWDDFWAVRALGDAAFLATARGDAAEAARLTALRDDFRASIRDSLAHTIATRNIAYVPGSVEWADFDPTATSNAVALLGEAALMPRAVLDATFAEYLKGFRRRVRNEIDWANYTAYEVRIIGALVCLGERASAAELAELLLDDRRPRPWNQWPEISWRNPRSPGHIGDVPHAWIAAEYVLAVRTMLAYERMDDEALVLAAGVPSAWLDGGDPVAVDGLATYWGTLGFTLRRVDATTLALELRGDAAPPGGLVLRPPLGGRLVEVAIDGAPAAGFAHDEVVVPRTPAAIVLRHGSPS